MPYSTKVMKWSKDHKDHYLYNARAGQWEKLECRMSANWDTCTAPQTLPRGSKFDYNGRVSDKL